MFELFVSNFCDYTGVSVTHSSKEIIKSLKFDPCHGTKRWFLGLLVWKSSNLYDIFHHCFFFRANMNIVQVVTKDGANFIYLVLLKVNKG